MTLIRNLKAIFTGTAFQEKRGRHITPEDASCLKGPIDIKINSKGCIQEIGKNLSTDEHTVVDGENLVATAGFVDSHTHSLFTGKRSKEYFMRWAGKSYQEIAKAGGGILKTFQDVKTLEDQSLFEELKKSIVLAQQSGTTTLEIKSGYGKDPQGEIRLLKIIKKLKDFLNNDSIKSTFLGLHALAPDEIEEDYVNGMIEVLPYVSQNNIADFVDAWPEKGFFSLSQSLRFCEEAAKWNLPSKIHADEISDMKATEYFVQRNAASVDHLQKVNKQGLELLALKNTTATVLPATSFYLGIEYVDARRLIDHGAQVALATDFNPGTAPNYSMGFSQLLAASQLKMTPTEILCASTYNGASALNLEHDRGILKSSYRADLLLWSCESADFLEEIFMSNKEPSSVWIKGQQISFKN